MRWSPLGRVVGFRYLESECGAGVAEFSGGEMKEHIHAYGPPVIATESLFEHFTFTRQHQRWTDG